MSILYSKIYKCEDGEKYNQETEGFYAYVPNFFNNNFDRLCLNRGGFLMKGKEK